MKLRIKSKKFPCIVTGCFLTPFALSGLSCLIEGIILYNKGNEKSVMLIVFGAMFMIGTLAIGGVVIASILKSHNKSTITAKERLYKKGVLMKATVGNVLEEPGTNLSRVFCYYEDKDRNKMYRFISDTFSNTDVIFFAEGMELDVYVNPHNKDDYYVAIEDAGVTPVA